MPDLIMTSNKTDCQIQNGSAHTADFQTSIFDPPPSPHPPQKRQPKNCRKSYSSTLLFLLLLLLLLLLPLIPFQSIGPLILLTTHGVSFDLCDDLILLSVQANAIKREKPELMLSACGSINLFFFFFVSVQFLSSTCVTCWAQLLVVTVSRPASVRPARELHKS